MRLEIINIIDHPDGTADLVIEIDDEYKEMLKKRLGLKRWNEKRVGKFFKGLLEEAVSNNPL